MKEKYFEDLNDRISKALKNKMPFESKLIFVGELLTAYDFNMISLREFDETIQKLGFTRQELYKWTDYVIFGEPQEDD